MRAIGAQGLFAVKGNQKALLASCERRSRFPAQETHRTLDKHRGRVVERLTTTWTVPAREKRKRFWAVFETIIKTERITHHRNRSTTSEVAFHVTTASVSAAKAAELVRGHWRIENAFHGLRDVGFKEDASQATGLTARGLAHLRTWAINFAHDRKTKLTKAQREMWRDPRNLFAWLTK